MLRSYLSIKIDASWNIECGRKRGIRQSHPKTEKQKKLLLHDSGYGENFLFDPCPGSLSKYCLIRFWPSIADLSNTSNTRIWCTIPSNHFWRRSVLCMILDSNGTAFIGMNLLCREGGFEYDWRTCSRMRSLSFLFSLFPIIPMKELVAIVPNSLI
jgi:hypothetical protein